MGLSIYAILVFGIDLGEDPEYNSKYNFSFLDFELVKEYGIVEAFEEIEEVELIIYGCYDPSSYILAVPGTEISTCWDSVEINCLPEINSIKLKKYMSWLLDHDMTDLPTWHLCPLMI